MLAEDYQLFVNNYNHKRVFYHDLENQHLIIKKYLEKKYEKEAEGIYGKCTNLVMKWR